MSHEAGRFSCHGEHEPNPDARFHVVARMVKSMTLNLRAMSDSEIAELVEELVDDTLESLVKAYEENNHEAAVAVSGSFGFLRAIKSLVKMGEARVAITLIEQVVAAEIEGLS